MLRPETPNDPARGKSPSEKPPAPSTPTRGRRVLNGWLLVGTVATLAVLPIAAYFWRGYQVKHTAFAITDRAEAFAEKKDYATAAAYYARYLELRPEDSNARLRRAEIYELATGGQGGFQALVELYQEALRPSSQGLAPEKELQARRRLTELLAQAGEFAAAQSEVENLRKLEQKELAQKPDEWRWPGLKALTLAGKFRADNASVPRAELEAAFAAVIEPEKAGSPKVYQDPAVYLARYEYRLQQQLPNASEDLDAALKLAPTNVQVLLTAAAVAQSEGAAATAAARSEAATAATAQSEAVAAGLGSQELEGLRVAEIRRRPTLPIPKPTNSTNAPSSPPPRIRGLTRALAASTGPGLCRGTNPDLATRHERGQGRGQMHRTRYRSGRGPDPTGSPGGGRGCLERPRCAPRKTGSKVQVGDETSGRPAKRKTVLPKRPLR